jgi:hypothetical protein
VADLPFDPEHPPDDPPPGVAQPMLWRVAVRLHRDHDVVVRDRAGALVCDLCRQRWPCFGRRLAQRGLLAAWRRAEDRAEDRPDGRAEDRPAESPRRPGQDR